MDHLVYVAAAGAASVAERQAAVSHNLANVSTPGFKADLVQAESRYLQGPGISTSRIPVVSSREGSNVESGHIRATGRDLDVAVNGDGWMGVLAPDGTEALSRRGDLRVNEYGQLMNGAGQAVMGNSGPIALPPFDAVSVGVDGTVSIVPEGGLPSEQVAVDRIRLLNPDNKAVAKGEDGLFRTQEALEPDASVRLIPASLEGSNVNAVGEMVRMIELSRQFENQVKMMTMAQDMDAASAQLMRLE